MMTSGGSERNRSTTKMISQLIGRMARVRSKATRRPASNPLITIITASSMVTTTPDRMSGRYFSITLPLKKVSTKRSHALMGELVLCCHPERSEGSHGVASGDEVLRFAQDDTTEGRCLSTTKLVPLDLADEGAC